MSFVEEIFFCEGTFERLFLGAIFGTSAPHFIAGWKADFKDQEDNCQALVYYLQHATRAQLTFPVAVNGRSTVPVQTKCVLVQRFTLVCLFVFKYLLLRFIDVPIESCGKASPLRVALQASAPDILLILLRYEILRDNCTTTKKEQTFDKQKHPLIELNNPPSADSVPILCHRTMAPT